MSEQEDRPAYLRGHRLRGETLRFDLGREEEELRILARASRSGRAAKTLIKEGPLRVTLAVLENGAALEEHRVAGPVSLHVLHGRLKLKMPSGDAELAEGGLVALDQGVAHSATG